MLRLREVGKLYEKGDREIRGLRGVSLMVEEAEMVFIVGPSGSGKTTLLNLVGCLDTPTSGEVLIDGVETSSLGDGELTRIRRRKVGFVFQKFNLVPTLTARENVEMPLVFSGVPEGERREKALALLRRVGLDEFVGHKPSELSGGQAQRVAVAQGLANDPSILLCDEPTGNLDSGTGESVMALLEELNGEGATVVVVTHDEGIILEGCRVVRLMDGDIDAVETRR